MNRIGILLYYIGSLKFNPSIVNSAKMLIKNGYKVDILKPYNPDEGIESNNDLNIIHVCRYKSNPVARVISLLKFIKSSLFYIKNKNRNYKVLIGIDAYGLIISGILKYLLKIPLVYFSLEILSPKFNYISLKKKNILQRNAYILHHYLIKFFERFFHKQVLFTIIQDKNRWEILREINRLDNNSKAIFVPNSPLKDEGTIENTDYLHNKYGIPQNKKIVLYAGSLGEWTGIDKVFNSISAWPDEVVFVIHGRGMPQFIDYLKGNIMANYSHRVILSLDQLSENEYNLLVNSADIGIGWYKDLEDPNIYTIGASSGKIFYYLKYGLPVITNRLPDLVEIVERNNCGVCVSSEKDIGYAIKQILLNYKFYSDNAKKCFETYEFSIHYQEVINAV